MTSITITGNLTADPELRFTATGTAVASFTVAVNRRVKGADGWTDGPTTYWRASAWRGLAENLAASARRGDRVIVTGAVNDRSWTSADGTEHTTKEIDVDDVGLSVRFATATTTRATRTTTSSSDTTAWDTTTATPTPA